MGGHQIPGRGSGDDGFDEEGFDESQRAEILEVTRLGRGDGTIIIDLDPDLGVDDDVEDEDDLAMRDTQIGEQDDDADVTETALDEDEAQDDFDAGAGDDATLTDRDDVALKP